MPIHFEPVSSVDSAWLSMEQPTNLMMVTGIFHFAAPVELDHLKSILQHRWLAYRRFRQRVVHPKIPFAPAGWAPAFWEMDPQFDLHYHLTESRLSDPGDYGALQKRIGEIMSTPLDFSRPLWHMELIHNAQGSDVLAVRMHHVIADGMSMVQVLLSITDDKPDAPPPTSSRDSDPEAENEGDDSGSLIEEALGAVLQQASNAANTVIRMSEKVIQEVIESLSDPDKAMNLARQGTESAQTVRRVLMRNNDPETIFKGDLGVRKVAAWSQPISLSQVKQIKNRLGGTVNDVLISAVAGGVRRFLLRQREPVADLNFRAAVPVNLRKPDELNPLGNKFGLVFLSLPIGIEDPVERLDELRRRMDELKLSQEAPLFFGLLKSLGYAPGEVQSSVVAALAHKITAVMSNVPGPRQPLYLAGQEVDSMMFWVPQSGRVGLGVSILSYNDKVYVGVNTDAGLVPHPDGLIDGFYEEYLDLLKAADTAKTPRPKSAGKPPRKPSRTKARKNAAASERCKATTQAGSPCKNRAAPGSEYCRVHHPAAEPTD